MSIPVIFPLSRAFALGDSVYCWSEYMEREFLQDVHRSIKDVVLEASGVGGRLEPKNWMIGDMVVASGISMQTAQSLGMFLTMVRHRNVIKCMRTVQRRWRDTKQRERWLVVMMGLHPRLGQNSRLFNLEAGVIRMCLC